MSNYTLNMEFRRAVGGANVRITAIRIENKKPLIFLNYTEPDRPQLRMYEDDLDKLVWLERWVPVSKEETK